jgi:hypothetical protein
MRAGMCLSNIWFELKMTHATVLSVNPHSANKEKSVSNYRNRWTILVLNLKLNPPLIMETGESASRKFGAFFASKISELSRN